MSSIFVRNLDTKIVNRLKTIAKQHGRSLQGEIKAILTEAAAISRQWHEKLSGRDLTDSATLIREDRNR